MMKKYISILHKYLYSLQQPHQFNISEFDSTAAFGSSTEKNNSNAWMVSFADGVSTNSETKTGSLRVRAVRTF